MKPLIMSRHARRRSRLYDVSHQQIAEVVDAPEVLESAVKGRVNATRLMEGRRIRVTYLEEDQQYVKITVTPLDA